MENVGEDDSKQSLIKSIENVLEELNNTPVGSDENVTNNDKFDVVCNGKKTPKPQITR